LQEAGESFLAPKSSPSAPKSITIIWDGLLKLLISAMIFGSMAAA